MKGERLKVKGIFLLSIFIFQFSICFADDSIAVDQPKKEKKQIYYSTQVKLDILSPEYDESYPRIIREDVDYDDRAKYFHQTVCGMYARMALIMKMLEKPDRTPMARKYDTHNVKCSNPNCITSTEHYLPKLFKPLGGDMLLCKYCEGRTLI